MDNSALHSDVRRIVFEEDFRAGCPPCQARKLHSPSPAQRCELHFASRTSTNTNPNIMKEKKLLRVGLSLASASAVLLSVTQLNAGTGTDHGFFWSLFVSGGSANITFPNAGQ